jgi:predicted nuclease of predicted toxin-antitoxin system
MMQPPSVRLAVLIDGENIAGSHADDLFNRIEGLGNASVRRIYGDYQNGRMKDWAAASEKYALTAVHVHANGKNSTDIAMTIEAMDLLHSNRVDGFCLVTSDRDFTRLAIRIREQGFIVYGFGEKKSTNALVRAYATFFLLGADKPASSVEKLQEPSAAPAAEKSAAPRHPAKARPWIEKAFNASGKEWLSLSALGTAIRAQESAYLKKTGFASLKKLLTALNDSYEQGVAADGKTAQVRRRQP